MKKKCARLIFIEGEKSGEHSTEGAIFEILCKKGPPPVSCPSEGNSMPIRGYTVYVYIIYIIYIYIYIQIDIHIYGFSVATGKVLSFEVTKY